MTSTIRLIALLILGLLSITYYYITSSIHGEDKSFYLIFLSIQLIVYFLYKSASFIFPKEKSHINFWHIISFFFIELLILCMCFFGFQGGNIGLGLVIFFKIACILTVLGFLWLVFYTTGATIIQKIYLFEKEEGKIRFLVSLGLGFTIFMLLVFVLAYFGFYEIQYILLLITVCTAISYQELGNVLKNSKKILLSYEHNLDIKASFSDKINIGRVIDEFHFGIVSFLLGVNFINVFRPFPIGWDDLGVYMNYPRLLAHGGELLALGKMYSWELYTGIGFLTGNQAYAFFLNSFSGVIAFIVTYIAISLFLPEKKTVFNIPLLAGLILLCMPMTVFQLAKDMKLDFGLYSFSVIAISFLYYLVFHKKEKSYQGYFILGILIGFCFSIKLTSLLLLLASLGVIFYIQLGLLGFLGFLGVFIGVFTGAGLWPMMNVVIPEGVSSLQTHIFSLFCIALSLLSFAFIGYRGSDIQKKYIPLIGNISMVFLGFFIVLLPWFGKNIGEIPAGTNISIGYILSGNPDAYIPDYSLLYSQETLDAKKAMVNASMSSDGKTSNEDFGRYFGYEGGINNYLKLPWNLTFQTNQKGEFTDITFIYFTLIPLVFLFLPFRKEKYIYPLLGAEVVLLLYYIPNAIGQQVTEIFSHINLPEGYIFIFIFFLLPFIYLYFTLDRSDKIVKKFLAVYAFSMIYVFLWTIAAFGIVWYGIAMYFIFLAMIALSLASGHNTDKDTGYFGIYIVLSIIWIYFLFSALPHGITNLRTAGYTEYKLGQQTEEVALLSFHSDYLPILFFLNISKEKQNEVYSLYRNKLLEIIDDVPNTESLVQAIQGATTINQLGDILSQLVRFHLTPEADIGILKLQQELYKLVMNPTKGIENSANIYRVGTFLKYFISGNNSRVFEDSLLGEFGTYVSGDSSEKTLENFKKLGISYILLDLNAATIDQDPAQNLTKRYENMLDILVNPKLKLIETDSICLKIALEVYSLEPDMKKYRELAGVNYGIGAARQEKQVQCLTLMSQLLVNKQVGFESFPYLLPYQNALTSLKVDSSNLEEVEKALAPYFQQGYKALFEILP